MKSGSKARFTALRCLLLLGVVACDSNENPNDTLAGQSGSSNPPNRGSSGQPGSGGGGGAVASPLKSIMKTLGQGPNALTTQIGNELKAETPPWDQLTEQTKQYVQLASDLAKYDPPKGSKESWTEQTAGYSKLAIALNEATVAHNAEGALDAHGQIARSCMSCHREHRMMGPGGRPGGGPGGPGGPAGGGPPPDGFQGGPPPGGFGGSEKPPNK
jgi:hypothetical protein